MKTIVRIIVQHGGLEALRAKAIRIDPPSSGLMRLCIEHVGRGPRGLEMISVAHYYEQNGDLMADPEMTIELPPDSWQEGKDWGPTSFTMHGIGMSQQSVFADEKGVVYAVPRWIKDQRSFMRMWDRNLKQQGFLEAFKVQQTQSSLKGGA